MKKEYLIIGVLCLVIAGGAFFGGMQYQRSTTRTQFAQFATGMNRGGGRMQNMGSGTSRPISGSIIDLTDDSMTLKTVDGGSTIVLFSDQTKTMITTEGNAADLSKDTEVTIFGTAGDNGVWNAQQIVVGKMLGVPVLRSTPSAQPTQ